MKQTKEERLMEVRYRKNRRKIKREESMGIFNKLKQFIFGQDWPLYNPNFARYNPRNTKDLMKYMRDYLRDDSGIVYFELRFH